MQSRQDWNSQPSCPSLQNALELQVSVLYLDWNNYSIEVLWQWLFWPWQWYIIMTRNKKRWKEKKEYMPLQYHLEKDF